MTKPMNRADRIHSRRKGALDRIEAGLRSGERFSDVSGICKHNIDSRVRAEAEARILSDRTAAQPLPKFTRKKLSDPNCSAARKALRSGRLTR